MPLTPALICGGPRPHPEQQLIQGPIGGTGSQSTCQSFGGRRLYYRDGSSGRGGNWVVVLPKATTQVIGPFHVISLANRCLDAVRRRVQSEQTGHRGRRDDPLYRARRVLLFAEERLDEQAAERLWSLLELGDPGGEVAIAYRSKSASATSIAAPTQTRPARCSKSSRPTASNAPCRRRSKARVHDQELVRQDRQLSPGQVSNQIKRIKRIGFGFRNLEKYPIRAPLYAGRRTGVCWARSSSVEPTLTGRPGLDWIPSWTNETRDGFWLSDLAHHGPSVAHHERVCRQAAPVRSIKDPFASGGGSFELRVYAGTDPNSKRRRCVTRTVRGDRADALRELRRQRRTPKSGPAVGTRIPRSPAPSSSVTSNQGS